MKKKKKPKQANKQNKKTKQKTQAYIAVKNLRWKKDDTYRHLVGGLNRPMSINFYFFLNVMDSNNFYFLVFKWHCLQTMK